MINEGLLRLLEDNDLGSLKIMTLVLLRLTFNYRKSQKTTKASNCLCNSLRANASNCLCNLLRDEARRATSLMKNKIEHKIEYGGGGAYLPFGCAYTKNTLACQCKFRTIRGTKGDFI